MRFIKVFTLVFILTIFSCVAFAMTLNIDNETIEYAGPEVTLVLNGEKFTPSENQMPPVILDNRTLVPVREIFEALGGKVDWDNSLKKATISTDTIKVELIINNNVALINGESKELDVPAKIINNKTMVPVRFISESIGLTVDWDNDTKTVSISKGEVGIPSGDVKGSTTAPDTGSVPFAVTTFNSKFEKSFGHGKQKSGTQQLSEIVINNNTARNGHEITLVLIDEKGNTYSESSLQGLYEIKKNLIQSLNCTYDVEGEYGEDGYLNKIIMTRFKI